MFDFGHSAVKRGIATFAAGRVEHVQLLPSLPAPAEADVVEFFSTRSADSRRSSASLAILRTTCPIDRYGLYAPVAAIDRGRLAGVAFVHDGTADRRAVTADAPAAAVVLGTALGVGFAPPCSALVPLSPTSSVFRR